MPHYRQFQQRTHIFRMASHAHLFPRFGNVFCAFPLIWIFWGIFLKRNIHHQAHYACSSLSAFLYLLPSLESVQIKQDHLCHMKSINSKIWKQSFPFDLVLVSQVITLVFNHFWEHEKKWMLIMLSAGIFSLSKLQ